MYVLTTLVDCQLISPTSCGAVTLKGSIFTSMVTLPRYWSGVTLDVVWCNGLPARLPPVRDTCGCSEWELTAGILQNTRYSGGLMTIETRAGLARLTPVTYSTFTTVPGTGNLQSVWRANQIPRISGLTHHVFSTRLRRVSATVWESCVRKAYTQWASYKKLIEISLRRFVSGSLNPSNGMVYVKAERWGRVRINYQLNVYSGPRIKAHQCRVRRTEATIHDSDHFRFRVSMDWAWGCAHHNYIPSALIPLPLHAKDTIKRSGDGLDVLGVCRIDIHTYNLRQV